MGIYPPSLEKLIDELTRLPGIGQKSAARMALHIMKSDREMAESLARSLLDVKDKIRLCSICFNLTDNDPCPVCRDPNRSEEAICVVESPGDQLALENSGNFKGKYHVLHGVLSPLEGIGPGDLKIGELLSRAQKEKVREIILATNPTTEGEATASFIFKLLSEKNPRLRVSRIALGIPMGGDLKYTDRMTLQHAISGRIPVTS